MTDTQLAHYTKLQGFQQKAEFLVRIGQARSFGDACSQIASRRRRLAQDRARHAAERELENQKRAVAANIYFD